MFYQFESVSPRITRIWDVSRTAMYLIEGGEAAALIDTGVGVGSLKSAVESITDKPITVILTHGHVDHAMAAGEFEKVYMSPADAPVYAIHSLMDVRKGYVSGAAMTGADPKILAQVQQSDYLPPKAADSFLPLEDGMLLPLGDVSIQAFAVPGHTPGSMAILIPEEESLILGDSCNAFTYLFDSFCPSVAEYRKNLLKLRDTTKGKYSRCLFSHGLGDGCPEMIENVIAVCDDILAERTDNIPFRGFNGESALIAKAMDFSRLCRSDGSEGNVIYNPNKIR